MEHLNFFKKWSLLERKNIGTIYHFTSLVNAYHIITSNCMVSYREVEESHNLYTFSFTRDKNLSNRIDQGQIDTILTTRLSIDGNKLSDKYKIRPYDYWKGTSINKINTESEEVLVKNNSYLRDINDYIIDINLPTYEDFKEEFEFYTESDVGFLYNLLSITDELGYSEEFNEYELDYSEELVKEVYNYIIYEIQ